MFKNVKTSRVLESAKKVGGRGGRERERKEKRIYMRHVRTRAICVLFTEQIIGSHALCLTSYSLKVSC